MYYVSMKQCHVVTFTTPDKLQLDGLWFGSTTAKKGFVYVHGLSSSVFSKNDALPYGDEFAALYFNNRGHDNVTGIKRMNDTAKGYEWYPGGAAQEIFEECVMDIQGAIDYMKQQGIEEVYLVGHSTGCQKSAYYLSQQAPDLVKGAVLICPVSDYAAISKHTERTLLDKATDRARSMVENDRGADFMDRAVWPETLSAQRFLSLYDPTSTEEIFCYGSSDRDPEVLQAVQAPLLLLLAENDEYHDRPVSELVAWFERCKPDADIKILPGSLHSLKGQDENISKFITEWIQQQTA